MEQQAEVEDKYDALPSEELATLDRESWKNAVSLSNSEMRFLLAAHVEKTRQKNPNYLPTPITQRSMDYLARFGAGMKNEEAMRALRTTLHQGNLYQHEISIISNSMPETAEEAMALAPSLKDAERFPSEDNLQQILDEIRHLRE